MGYLYSDIDTVGQVPGSAITKSHCGTLPDVRNKSLPLSQNEAARAFVRALVDSEFEGNTNAAAKKLGLSQSMLYEFLDGTRGAGMKLLNAVAVHTRRTIDEVVGRPPQIALPLGDEEPAHQNIPGWTERCGEIAEENPGIPRWVYEQSGRIRGMAVPDPITKQYVLNTLMYVLSNTPDEIKKARMRAETESKMQGLITRGENRDRKEFNARQARELPANDAPLKLTDESAPAKPARGRRK